MTTGKVLKERRAPRERGRTGSSLTAAAANSAAASALRRRDAIHLVLEREVDDACARVRVPPRDGLIERRGEEHPGVHRIPIHRRHRECVPRRSRRAVAGAAPHAQDRVVRRDAGARIHARRLRGVVHRDRRVRRAREQVPVLGLVHAQRVDAGRPRHRQRLVPRERQRVAASRRDVREEGARAREPELAVRERRARGVPRVARRGRHRARRSRPATWSSSSLAPARLRFSRRQVAASPTAVECQVALTDLIGTRDARAARRRRRSLVRARSRDVSSPP